MTRQEMYTELEGNFEETRSWRRHLHENPELSFQETETARFIEGKLREFGLEVKTGIGGNGITGTLRGAKAGKTIAFRADFDALPITDEKDAPYKSKNPGVMHACGHDGHTSALLSVAKVLSQYGQDLNGTLIFLFQPAEETPPGGAKFMIEEGVLEGVDHVFGAHLASDLPLGSFGVGEGFRMAAVDRFAIHINGLGGHGAMPHTTIDPLVIGTTVVNALQQIVSRKVDPLKSAVVTIGIFKAGTAFNVIPDNVTIEGTVRTFEGEVRDQVQEEIHSIVAGITSGFKATHSIDYLRGYPALYNHPEETEIAHRLFADLGPVVESEPTMGAEDFAYYLQEKPGTFFRVGSRTDDLATQYSHHHPRFDIDERALVNTGKAFIKLAEHYVF
ncbi:M20 metallopeptidase family protein [Rossellomorea marisflavi]|uniref:M20 metallopeptidase family protein n=1 Tax=Rossellomorea marisflavi TaxID=189381 RepID=UPI00345A2C74